MGSEAAAEEPREAVRLLERLRSRESGDDPALGAAEQRLDAIERVIPSDRLEAEPATGERLGDAIGGLQVGVSEPALVAQPAAVDLGMVAREDALDLAFADGGR